MKFTATAPGFEIVIFSWPTNDPDEPTVLVGVQTAVYTSAPGRE